MLTKILSILMILAGLAGYGQTHPKGRIIDASTQEPLAGATVRCLDHGCNKTCLTNASGFFEMHCSECKKMQITHVGYVSVSLPPSSTLTVISLQPNQSLLQGVVVTANRDAVRRSEAPVAITNLSARTLQDAKPTSIDQVLNKISGVHMVNLGNEQHQMSIR